MEKACLTISPASDEKLWSRLRSRVDSIVEDLKSNPNPNPCAQVSRSDALASERSKRLREDSMLLLKGLDSVSSTLSQLSDTLNSAQKDVKSSRDSCRHRSRDDLTGADALANSIQDDEEPRAKRHRSSLEFTESTTSDNVSDQSKENLVSDGAAAKSSNLKTARMLALSMANKAAFLSRELKNMKSELSSMQERCNQLEEENRSLREEGYERGASHDDEDLLRLQLEALLAEKSRLAQENANLTRENRSLNQLVEYHQLTSQDLFASFEEIEGKYLDFFSPVMEEENGDDEEEEEERDAVTPTV